VFSLGQIKAVAFDLDGTLIKTSVDFKKMKREIICLFGSFGIDQNLFTTSELTYTIIQRGLGLLTSQGIPDDRIAVMDADITRIMNRVELESIPRVEAVPGVQETLSTLRDYGMSIGLITRGCRAYTLAALDKIGVSDMIDVILARDDVDRPKPHPFHLLELAKRLEVDRGEIVLIGDHRSDFLCAQAAQVAFVGIPSGSSNLEELIEEGPRAAIIGDLVDLPAFLTRFPLEI